MKRRVIVFLAVIGLFLPLDPAYTATASLTEFPDVPSSHWAYDDVMQGVSKGYINGLPDGSFAPDRSVSRAEFIKMTVAALELPIEEQEPGEAWYVPYTNVALEHGLIDPVEYEDEDYTRFMSRMEMVRVAVKAIDESTRNAGLLNEELMVKAVENGIIRGIDGKTVPQGTSTRAQAVTVIERMLTVLDGGNLPVDEAVLEVAEVEYWIATGDVWDPEKPYAKTAKLEVSRYFEMQVHESLRVEDGHLKGYLPKLPEGLEYSLSFLVEYDPKDKVTSTNDDFLNFGVDLKPGESFSLPIIQEDKVKGMFLSVGVRVTENSSKRRYSIMDYYNNRQITEYVKY